MTQPTGEEPQDAPAGQPWTPWPQAPDAFPSAGSSRSGAAVAGSHDPGASADRGRFPGGASSVATAPTGPNWLLAVIGLLLLLTAGGQLAYLLGYRPDRDVQFGPQALIAAGALLLLVGVVGLIARRAGRR